ncbi:MAG: diguanylate cyclase [Bermanella sp.]
MINQSFSLKIILISALPLTLLAVILIFILYDSNNRLLHSTSKITLNKVNEIYLEILRDQTASIAQKTDLKLQMVNNELRILAHTMQILIDEKESFKEMVVASQAVPYNQQIFKYNQKYNASNLDKNRANINFHMWGYLHDEKGNLKADVRKYANKLTLLNPLVNAMGSKGVDKAWLYIVGPYQMPFIYGYPWADVFSVMKENYPDYNSSNWWDYFFPNIIEGWHKWAEGSDPSQSSAKDIITITPFYHDAAGMGNMVTFFHPLWTVERKQSFGAVAIDYSIDNIINEISSEVIGESGFSFLMLEDGDIVGINQQESSILGLNTTSIDDKGVKILHVNLFTSTHTQLSTFKQKWIKEADDNQIHELNLANKEYYLSIQLIKKIQTWDGQSISPKSYFIATILPKDEVNSIHKSIEKQITDSFYSSTKFMLITSIVIFFMVVVFSIYFSMTATKQIRLLTEIASNVKRGIFSPGVKVLANDELGFLAHTFNNMLEKISESIRKLKSHANILEATVARRTLDLEKANKELENLSNLDGLTMINNRRYFDTCLDNYWQQSRRKGEEISMVFIDIDYFKQFNDNYGHQLGDNCLKTIAHTIRDNCQRPSDIACRYGGEEFAILTLSTKENTCLLAEKVRAAIRNLNIPHDSSHENFVTVSLGVASIIPSQKISADLLIRQSDEALYTSKKNGRNLVSCYEDS